jgi:hypothetical protein
MTGRRNPDAGMALAHVVSRRRRGRSKPTHLTTEVRRASFCRNERSCLQDPGARRIFREELRGCDSVRALARMKNHSRYEMVRSGANERPHRRWIRAPLPGHLAGWIYPGGIISGEATGSPHEQSDMRDLDPDVAEFIIGRAFARPVGPSGLRLPKMGRRYCAVIDRSGPAGPTRSLNASNSAGL